MIEPEKLERLIVKYLLEEEDYFKLVIGSFDKESFNNRTIGEIVKFSGDYYKQYYKIPPEEFLRSFTGSKEDFDDLITEIKSIDFDYNKHKQYFLSETDNYLKTQSMKQGILDSADIVDRNGNLTIIPDIIQSSLSKTIFPKTTSDLEILGVYDFRDKRRPPRELMLSDWLMENQYVVVSGERGVGKSMFCLSLCVHLSMGTRFYTWKPTKRYKTLFIDGEMTSHETIDRLDTFNLEGFSDLNEYLFIYSVLDSENTTIQPLLTDKKFRQRIEEICLEKGIQLVVFDNKSSFAPGIEENSKTEEWDEINQWFISLRSKKINPLIVCHKGKNTKGPRGTSSIEDNNDISIELTRNSDYTRGGGCSFNLKFTKMRNYIENQIKFFKLFYVKNDGDEYFHWEGRDTSFENQDKFICLSLNDGIPQVTIGKKYSLSKSVVSKKKTKLHKDGYIENFGKLTNKGKLWTSDVEELYYESEKPYLLDQVEEETIVET